MHSYSLISCEEALGFLVLDNPLTQDHLTTLLARFFVTLSRYSFTKEEYEVGRANLIASLDESMANLGKAKSIQEDLDEFEVDDVQNIDFNLKAEQQSLVHELNLIKE
ncbi:hypothetical protein [Pseudobutyrivibrio sp. 49]|uniref:hypothetical protein n=1 Tax=Pseudobutyrivibrio sp. 49 TaxID=1855344 RepID=UPI0015A136DF|nr:hypothetical protein [Pseudobutyrivibrio sp. 49]